MDLGVSSLAYCVEYGLSGKYSDVYELIFDASRECLQFSEDNGIHICELVIDPADIFRDENLDNYIEMVSNFNLKKQVHGPFVDMGLCSHNKMISDASKQTYIESAQIANQLNAKKMTIHPGVSNFLIRSIQNFNQQRLIESTLEVLDGVQEYNIEICIENMPKNAGILLKTPEIKTFFDTINRKDLFMTYDTSHLWTCEGDVEKLWSELHDVIKNVHIVDNFTRDNDTHPGLGKGKIDFKEIFEVFRSYDYKGALIIELSQASELSSSMEYISKFL